MTGRMKKTWILVADGARAYIALNEGPGTGLAPATPIGYAASHAPSRDFGTDKPGRAQSADGAHHVKASRVDWHEYEKQKFAKSMAEVVDTALTKGAFDQLVLVAPPATLGELRKSLGHKATERVVGELAKDLTHLKLHELAPHLQDVIRL